MLLAQFTELQYILLLFLLFIVPKFLQRYRVPAALTSFFMGILLSIITPWISEDSTIQLLSTFGIVSLFLFAGLEMDFNAVKLRAAKISQYIIVYIILLAGSVIVFFHLFGMDFPSSVLIVLALTTPSAGFILESLNSLGMNDAEKKWIKAKVVSSEILALIILFFIVQSSSAFLLIVSSLVLITMAALLPVLFMLYDKYILPHAKNSEFAFLLMTAVLCAMVTRKLGVYYLLGAFIAGTAAQLYKKRMPVLTSEHTLHSVEVFSSFFIPFYFFKAGMHFEPEKLTVLSLLIGLGFIGVFIIVRFIVGALQHKFMAKEPLFTSARISGVLLPTMVFTLVLADILKKDFNIDIALFGGLIIYAFVSALAPLFFLKRLSDDTNCKLLSFFFPGMK